MKLTGAQIIMECLLEQHVDTVFGLEKYRKNMRIF